LKRRAAVVVAALGLCTRALALGQGPVAAPGGWSTLELVGHKAQSRAGKEPWTPVAAGAVLGLDDALRTLERSSAAARLDGGGRILLTELTTVTLRGARSLVLVAGQLDAELSADAAPVELEAGRARISVGAGEGPALVRVRLRDAAPQVMVLAGTARVAAGGGAALEVAAGSGLTVGSAGASGAEKLLPAPLTSAPAPGSAPDHANPRLWWEDVPGARAYTVEVCHDEACGGLEDRAVAVIGAPWAPEGLPLGELYWRVVAVSASGLDGMPSRAVRFTIRSLWRKPHPRPPSS
jgi:hypothetical protein